MLPRCITKDPPCASSRIDFFSSISLGTQCHAPNPGPTRLADPNRFPGRETQDWDSLPDFFFKPNWYLWVWPTSYNRIKISYTILESHLQIQNYTFTFTNQRTEPTVMNPYWCVDLAVCGCLLTSSLVLTRIKNPC